VTTRKSVRDKKKKTHTRCIMCGDSNLLSLRLKFEPGTNGDVSASFQGNSRLQGYDGILHGGVISALLDSVMTNCLFQRNIEAVTADLRVRFLLPVPCNASLNLRAWIVEETRMLFKLKAELTLEDTIMARAEALFVNSVTSGMSNA
jgi:acyl-coenzyme A thioesterase PaaI-like protein